MADATTPLQTTGEHSDVHATVYVGRQPIFDRQRRTYAFQLLHRSTEENEAGDFDGDEATRTMIDRLVFQWGLDHLLGPRPGFLHITQSILRAGLHRLLPPDRILLELLDDVDLDDDTRQLAKEARRLGYRLAVDNVVRTTRPVMRPNCTVALRYFWLPAVPASASNAAA